MKFTLDNIGTLKHAELELGELTIICGENNMGKTYATYAIYGFLNFIEYPKINIFPKQKFDELITKGRTKINIKDYIKNDLGKIIKKYSMIYPSELNRIFSSSEDFFSESKFSVKLDLDKIKLPIGAINLESRYFRMLKSKNSDILEFFLTTPINNKSKEVDKDRHLKFNIKFQATSYLYHTIFPHCFPTVFISSTERTGISIFTSDIDAGNEKFIDNMKELNVLLDKLIEIEQKINSKGSNSELQKRKEFLQRQEFEYRYSPNRRLNHALPVKENFQFTRDIENIVKRDSFIKQKHANILSDFDQIAGGSYAVSDAGQVNFIPKNGKNIPLGINDQLSMSESASSVRALLMLNYYLRHLAEKGGLLIIDEPELNLHPRNQRRMARLIARLVNAGIQVFITTHSDYIIRELNNLMMMGASKKQFEKMSKEKDHPIAKGKYEVTELLSPHQIKAYIATSPNSKNTKQKFGNLEPVRIDEKGMDMTSFDDVIEDMNALYNVLVWG